MLTTIRYQPLNLARWLIWSSFALLLLIAPKLFTHGAALSLLSQIGTLMIFGLSFNMLLGQGGMLSFGHAVYSGLGAFFAIHAMNLAGAGQIPLPLPLIPLAGGLAGMGFGILFGYVTTKKSGTTFSMITLGMVELVFACSLMFPKFFGGEGGISSNRVYGEALFGINFGPQIQVYYLIAVWLFISTVAMFAFTHTPLGRICNAVRDNPERAEFVGYNTQWVRYLTLIVSAFFAGVSGGLSAINFEIVTAENVSAVRSGAVLLFTFIGGIGFFFGPMIGAVIGVFLTVMLSDLTKAWQLYLGVFFIVIVMFAPGGIASLIMLQLRVMVHGMLRKIALPFLKVSLSCVLAFCGLVMLTEMLYQRSLEQAAGPILHLLGMTLSVQNWQDWVLAVLVLLTGTTGFFFFSKPYMYVWNLVNTEIEDKIRRSQA
ncbi:branched-chain amino acid ABC transporter permease [Undibacterium rugosum]|uniref:Branched-chain amino acid ABC transporter permease n=1 Tax=Undibacterium rugosum TaxID=2762291 RepID=A0A923KTA7_9BURK|nr:branched-chain amino acid ABC transporter permease [Undibacterium rugosum]MBC3935839.1 branched-chain amino acid ABC transporter permease [Undibacterium rugosum]MBR7779379.1 branched-chain amino acid ABC transporter permease [Undibacterium rugosum]